MQEVCLALHFALLKAGNSIAARMAMMAITTSNSISVKPCGVHLRFLSRENLLIDPDSGSRANFATLQSGMFLASILIFTTEVKMRAG
jgi:hypothetical protein